METRGDSFEIAVQCHDARVAALGLSIWVGSEPTFTDRNALTPAWLNAALGDDKEQRAQSLITSLSGLMPGGMLLRSVGRQYPGEKCPRWNLGLLRRRDGSRLWLGPPDPLLLSAHSDVTHLDVARFASTLVDAFEQQTWRSECLETRTDDHGVVWKVRAIVEANSPVCLDFLLHLHGEPQDAALGSAFSVAIVLPAVPSVDLLQTVLSCLGHAATASGLPSLIVEGASPPVDHTLELTTVTPDPAVVEVNTAPSCDCVEFLWRSKQVYAAAMLQGLSPYRLYFNGQVADSGGAGQITFGGSTPESSPFVQHPRLLPQLVRFLNRHPSLSYLFSHDFVGAGGQSVRPDERGTDAFDDLVLALKLLERKPEVGPELLWNSLASFLCDAVGNNHRAEVNIEKLWNPFLADRGRLGLVEFRSLRMQHTPQRATAIACLLRAVIAMLASRQYAMPLIDWGRELHDRFALPFYLRLDLDAVFAELKVAGLELDLPIQDVLQQNEFRFFGKVDFEFATLELWRALEFWPLVGDAASPEQTGSSRTVDASTTRIELRWRPAMPKLSDSFSQGNWLDWRVYAGDICLPMRPERDSAGELGVFGLRYRSFVPRSGLHPVLEAQAPLTLQLRHVSQRTRYVVKLHEWHPEGQAYPGLPTDLGDARERRLARITVEQGEHSAVKADHDSGVKASLSQAGLTPYSLDLRFG